MSEEIRSRDGLPPFWVALVPVLGLVVLLVISIRLFGADSASGANQVALMGGAVVAALVAVARGHSWREIEVAILHSIGLTMGAILILIAVGALIGTWILGGVVPTLIHFGLAVLDPDFFYFATCAICALVSLSIGSSWTTAGTVGVAFIGIAQGFGLSPAVTAGAVISGAYFGDKMSPLSDTTNLAAAVGGADLFAHIRNMAWTTGPSLVIALTIFAILGSGSTAVDLSAVAAIQQVMADNFTIHWVMLVPLFAVLALAALRMPALPTIIMGAILGAVAAILFQGEAVARYGALLGGDHAAWRAIWTAFFDGYVVETGNADVDGLLSRGGMAAMLPTVWLIISAMVFGGIMEHTGMLGSLLAGIIKRLRRVGSLIVTTVLACIGTNLVAAEQYMSIAIPARMLAPVYERFGLAPTALSRTIEDSGTLTSPLVPWNTCGAFMAATLGVATLEYLPFAFLNLINPLIAIIFGYTGIAIARLAPAPAKQL